MRDIGTNPIEDQSFFGGESSQDYLLVENIDIMDHPELGDIKKKLD